MHARELIRVAGNETAFKRWITDFLQLSKFMEEMKEGRYTFFKKTERGGPFHKTLKDWRMIIDFRRLSGKRLKRETQVNR